MSTHQTPTTPDELLRLYLRGLLDAHSFNTHLLLILIDLVEEQRLLRGLLDASTTELQVQARDLVALATWLSVMLASQGTTYQKQMTRPYPIEKSPETNA
jgi:hypothetical protein